MQAPNVIRIIIRVLLADRSALIAENLALRQQLAVVCRTAKRPRLRRRDRIFWVWISKLWRGWRSALIVVQPDGGTAEASDFTGAGSPGREDGRRYPVRSGI